MSEMYYDIKNWVTTGLWSIKRLNNALAKHKITEDEYKEILSLVKDKEINND